MLCALVVAACSGSSASPSNPSSASTGPVAGVEIERAPSRNHRNGPIDYSGKKPPTGGDHNPVPLTCGAYSEQPPDEYAVHSLEHGAVWIAYGPSVPAADVTTLRRFAQQPKVIVTPYADLDAPIVMVAWEHRLELQSASDPRITAFIVAYGNGKVAPEPTAACSGIGVPDQHG